MKKTKKLPRKTERLIVDEFFSLAKSRGNGVIRRQVWCDNDDVVTRYSLAYINHRLFTGDNGRVLGYDNAHGYHHKHVMGKIELVTFNNFLEIEDRFHREFEVMHEKSQKKE